jgi:uncharacterized protein YciI
VSPTVRRLLVRALLAACLAEPSLFAAEPPAPVYGKANPGPISGYVMLIRLRWDLYARWKETGKWPDDPAANAAWAGHGRYWDEQRKAGRALLAGGMKGDNWDDVALIVFKAKSLDEARAIAAADPAVKAYVFQAEVRPFDVQFLTNKFQAAPKPVDPP